MRILNGIHFLIPLVFVGCGYHFQTTLSPQSSVTIPYIKGDLDGLFTSIFIRNFTQRGAYQYVSSDGENSLEITLIGNEMTEIGYQYDREEITGELIRRLEPTEGRRTVSAKVSLIDSATGEIVKGPFVVTASTDYDFVDKDSAVDVSFIDQSQQRRSVLDFSLGQLDSREGAEDISRRPAFNRLSQKILDALLAPQ